MGAVADRSSAGKRVLLNRLYAAYEADPAFAHMVPDTNGVVPGDGPTKPRLVFLGEAPGRTENKMRKPFTGASGQFLNELLASVGLRREQVFITNTVKIWPWVRHPGSNSRQKLMPQRNRPPTEEEKLASIPYLRREIELLGYPPIVVLGKHAKSAMAQLRPSGARLGDPALDLRLGEWSITLGVPMLPLHHPAYGIYQQANRPMMFEMFKAVLKPPPMPVF
jgi:uracil-DNA glycosylase